jgi:hypothetical protein
MNTSKALINPSIGLIGFLLLAFSGVSQAQDGDRITQLEKEVQELKLRLTKLETPQGNLNSHQESIVSNEGWKLLANWRALKNGMSYEKVRATLGEPERITGGVVAFWSYPNRGSVEFINDQLTHWSEPLI